jgi:hypothetical protein
MTYPRRTGGGCGGRARRIDRVERLTTRRPVATGQSAAAAKNVHDSLATVCHPPRPTAPHPPRSFMRDALPNSRAAASPRPLAGSRAGRRPASMVVAWQPGSPRAQMQCIRSGTSHWQHKGFRREHARRRVVHRMAGDVRTVQGEVAHCSLDCAICQAMLKTQDLNDSGFWTGSRQAS